MNNAQDIPEDPNEFTIEFINVIGNYGQKSTRMLYEILCVQAADTGLKQTISDKIVFKAAANQVQKANNASCCIRYQSSCCLYQ